MVITPQGVVKLLANCPVTDYNNQIDFANARDQEIYFSTLVSNSLPEGKGGFTYIRKTGALKVEVPVDELYDCNYLMYKNVGFTNKWFYAFIRNIEYINATTTLIVFEVDEWQTWQFDLKFYQSFVEREHTATDAFGEHLIEENIACGDYVTTKYERIDLSQSVIAVCSTVDLNGNTFPPIGGSMVDGVYSGAKINYFGSANSVNAVLQKVAKAGKSDAITGIYMYPSVFGGIGVTQNKKNYNLPVSNTLDGYVPRNAKLLQYPFRCAVISSGTMAKTLRYEFFVGTGQVQMVFNRTQNGSVLLYPLLYKNVETNAGEGVSLSGYEQCTWAKDNYTNWLASNNIKYAYTNQINDVEHSRRQDNIEANALQTEGNVALGALGQLIGGDSIGALGTISSGTASNVLNSYANYAKESMNYNYDKQIIDANMSAERAIHSIVPPSLNGAMSGSAMITAGLYGFWMLEQTITKNYAMAIDKYFDMYGYRVITVKDINYKSRPFWNYIKTAGINMTGQCPKDSLQIIKTMFNAGVTMWHKPEFFGDYSQANGIWKPTEDLSLTVVRGSGSGQYFKGSTVQITANEFVNSVFTHWVNNSANKIADIYSPTTTITMEYNDVVTAMYTQNPSNLYDVYVVNGSGSGAYTAGSNVTISANIITGQTFKGWQSADISLPAVTPTTFTMPANNVNITAVYDGEPIPPEYTTIDDWLASHEGAVEWDATVTEIINYFNQGQVAWCAMAVYYAALKVGVQTQLRRTAGVDEMWNAVSASKKWRTEIYGGNSRMPVKGDLIYFSNGHTTADLTHVGAVQGVDGGVITYISGNTTNPASGPDGIFSKTINVTNPYVVGFSEIDYG